MDLSTTLPVKGIYMPSKFIELEDVVYNWSVRNEDVWICSFPKSGTTWTQEMVWMIMNNFNLEGAKEDLDARSPFFELSGLYHDYEIRNSGNVKLPLFYENSLEYTRKFSETGPICIKSHLSWMLLPKEIQENIKKPKIIYVTRNPKDVCVSFYHHGVLLGDVTDSFDSFCELFLNDQVVWGPYWQHVLPFWQRRHESNFLILTYEEMHKDLPTAIRKVAKFLEKPLTDDQVNFLSEHLNFSNMKNNKALTKESYLKFYAQNDKIKGKFFRSGKIGGYKSEMTNEINSKFDKWILKNISGTEYKI